jgi:6-pyruvoyltetrahydropterin/6-carboxytetrahydropterin synthase
MIYIERTERFSAAHQLFNPNWSEEKNREIFGKCSNKNFHGHNYALTVTVKGHINPETGFVMNLVDLKRIITKEVVDKLDHANLNHDVDFMQGKFSSTEVLAQEIWKILDPLIRPHGCQLHKIRLEETLNNAVEYLGEQEEM